jgi:PAS domain S-box-containing protein
MSEGKLHTDVRKEAGELGTLDRISAAAAVIGRDGHVVHANTRFAELLGCRGRDVTGLPLSALLPRIDLDALARVTEATRRRPGEAHKLTITREDYGILVQVDLLLRALGPEGQTYVLAVDRTPAKQRLERLRRRVDQLEAQLEIRTPARPPPPAARDGVPEPALAPDQPDQPLGSQARAGDVRMVEFLEQQVRWLGARHAAPGVRLAVAGTDAVLDARRATTVGLIVIELVTNALQHGFPDGRDGSVAVAFCRRDRDYELRVGDTGVGMATIMPTDPSALGLRLVQLYAQRLGARVGIEVAGGTQYTITFPVERLGEPVVPG